MSSRRTGAWRAFEAALAIAAAIPSIAGAALATPLALDDWAFAADSRYVSFARGFGADTRARPVGGLWHWAEFRLLGTHPVPHFVVLAALNAAAAILLWRLLDRWLPTRVAVASALVWVALPNRGSTHLWPSTATLVLSLVLMLGALLVASSEPLTGRRFGVALGLLTLSTLTYEGAIAIGLLALVVIVWTCAPTQLRLRWTAISVAVVGAAGGWVLVNSPKVGTSPTPFSNLSHLASAHAGNAVLPSIVLSAAVLLGVSWSFAMVVLPGFTPWPEHRVVLIGVGVLLLGAAPFAVVGFPFSGTGFFDRGNLFADLGTALVYGALLAMLFHIPTRAVAPVLAALALVAIGTLGIRSVRDYVQAGSDGRRFLAAVDRLPASTRIRGPVTFLPLPDHDGVAQFLADYDISAALALRYHTGLPYPRAQMAISATGFVRPEGPVFELVGRRLLLRAGGD